MVRAKGGVGLIVTGGVAPNKAGIDIIEGSIFTICIGRVALTAGMMTSSRDIANHKPVTQAVHENGGLIAMQILHSGRYELSFIKINEIIVMHIISIQLALLP